MEDAQLCQTEFRIEICKIEMKFCRFSEILVPFQRPLLGPPRIRAAQIKSAQIRADKVYLNYQIKNSIYLFYYLLFWPKAKKAIQ